MHLCHVEITQTLSPSIQSPSLHTTRSLDLDHFTRDAPIDCGDNWRYGLTGSIQGWGMPRSAPTTCHAPSHSEYKSSSPAHLLEDGGFFPVLALASLLASPAATYSLLPPYPPATSRTLPFRFIPGRSLSDFLEKFATQRTMELLRAGLRASERALLRPRRAAARSIATSLASIGETRYAAGSAALIFLDGSPGRRLARDRVSLTLLTASNRRSEVLWCTDCASMIRFADGATSSAYIRTDATPSVLAPTRHALAPPSGMGSSSSPATGGSLALWQHQFFSFFCGTASAPTRYAQSFVAVPGDMPDLIPNQDAAAAAASHTLHLVCLAVLANDTLPFPLLFAFFAAASSLVLTPPLPPPLLLTPVAAAVQAFQGCIAYRTDSLTFAGGEPHG
ncbi:hypothetical protein Q7P37_007180 [Cladosporium fusiforme]